MEWHGKAQKPKQRQVTTTSQDGAVWSVARGSLSTLARGEELGITFCVSLRLVGGTALDVVMRNVNDSWREFPDFASGVQGFVSAKARRPRQFQDASSPKHQLQASGPLGHTTWDLGDWQGRSAGAGKTGASAEYHGVMENTPKTRWRKADAVPIWQYLLQFCQAAGRASAQRNEASRCMALPTVAGSPNREVLNKQQCLVPHRYAPRTSRGAGKPSSLELD